MAGRAEEGIGGPEIVARQVAILADDILVAVNRLRRSLTRSKILSTPSRRWTGDLLVMAAFGQADEVGR
jgi:hypothetical protein